MFTFLVVVIIALFLAMLFVNVYFRVKVFKFYKPLVQNRVEFNASHVFNRQKMEEEVISKHPDMRENIEGFVKHMRMSINMATVLAA